MPRHATLKGKALADEMRRLGFRLERDCASGHSLYRHVESGELITVGRHIGHPRVLQAWARKCQRRHHSA